MIRSVQVSRIAR